MTRGGHAQLQERQQACSPVLIKVWARDRLSKELMENTVMPDGFRECAND